MDQVLMKMASELKDALLRAGLDPTNPPKGSAPSEKAFAEYQKRGGEGFSNPDAFMKALITKVSTS